MKVFSLQNKINLTNEEQIVCEGLLTKEECLKALKSMSLDKTPRTDGLPCEFYKVFWNDRLGRYFDKRS